MRFQLLGVFLTMILMTGSESAKGADFTVKDAIELTTFSDPSTRNSLAQTKFAPDGKHFIVVTTRGLIDSNEIESTLWLFESSRVRNYVHRGAGVRAPAPRRLVQLRGTPKGRQEAQSSYSSLITAVTWSEDSENLYFLGEDATGNRVLHRTNIQTGAEQRLTGTQEDVSKFTAAAGTIVYVSRVAGAWAAPAGTNTTAIVITDLSILFPREPRVSEAPLLGVIRHGQALTVLGPSSGRLSLASVSNLQPSVSPDGRFVIVAVAANAILPSWEAYQTAMPYLGFKARARDAAAQASMWPAQYGLIDLDRQEGRPLLAAPIGVFGGYHDAEKAVWSARGDSVLLGNTYLPVDGEDPAERAHRLQSCAFAVVRIASDKVSCVVYSRTAGADKNGRVAAYDAAFGKTADEVEVRLRWYNETREERYLYRAGQWRLLRTETRPREQTPARLSQAGSTLTVTLRQDLNVSPALWATDTATGDSRKLWDPNPQLAALDIGDASVYRWTDSTGYSWQGSLIKPVGFIAGKRYPLVIQTHGFHNEHEFITDGAFTTAFAARPLSSAGFVVLETRDRHDHDVTSEEAPDMIRGFESAIDALSADGFIDPQRVGIIGFSRTCYYTESALIHAPLRYAAGVIADGVDESYLQYLLWGVGRDVREEEAIYGTPPFGDGLKKWMNGAPGFNLNRVQTPLMIQAIAAPSILEEWELYAALRLQHKAVEMIYIPDGLHVLQKPLERLASQQTDVDWFRFWLQGYEDPSREKAEQYRRWQKLCDMQVQQNPQQPAYCVPSREH